MLEAAACFGWLGGQGLLSGSGAQLRDDGEGDLRLHVEGCEVAG